MRISLLLTLATASLLGTIADAALPSSESSGSTSSRRYRGLQEDGQCPARAALLATYYDCLDANGIRACEDCALGTYPGILETFVGVLLGTTSAPPCADAVPYMCQTLFGACPCLVPCAAETSAIMQCDTESYLGCTVACTASDAGGGGGGPAPTAPSPTSSGPPPVGAATPAPTSRPTPGAASTPSPTRAPTPVATATDPPTVEPTPGAADTSAPADEPQETGEPTPPPSAEPTARGDGGNSGAGPTTAAPATAPSGSGGTGPSGGGGGSGAGEGSGPSPAAGSSASSSPAGHGTLSAWIGPLALALILLWDRS